MYGLWDPVGRILGAERGLAHHLCWRKRSCLAGRRTGQEVGGQSVGGGWWGGVLLVVGAQRESPLA